VPLSFLLSAASPLPGASEVLLEGSDEGLLFENAKRGPYSRIVPLADCLAPEALVAYELNRQLLPRRNGFPARVLLPGWYGMNSVKWLRRIAILKAGERPSSFLEAGMDQLYVRMLKGQTDAHHLGRLQLKSEIAFPVEGARLLAGTQRIWGFAWGSDSPLRSVDVSTDGGRSWQPARLESAPDRLLWTRWSFDWQAGPGNYTLMSRAVNESRELQPMARDSLRVDGYELNQCARINCSVR
jgi:DMSO/TMAO reductase YedYZ molybdopterin-dependent catalytic subunit